MKRYHVGFAIRGKTLVIQARQSVDYLDCEIYDYFGVRETTKAELHRKRYDILIQAMSLNPVYCGLKYAVVA